MWVRVPLPVPATDLHFVIKMQVGCYCYFSKNTCFLYLYFFHHQFVDFLLQSQNFFLQSQTVGIEDWFPQYPLFLQLCDLFQFGCILFPQLFRVIPNGFIQNLLVNPVRAAITFPVPLVSPADVFHTAAAVPVTDHGTEYVPTFLTGQ